MIQIDDDVFMELQRRAEAFVDTPNSTLRRILDLPAENASAGRGTKAGGAQREQSLAPLLESGRLKAGEVLVWRRRNLRRTHRATVLADGSLRLEDGSVHTTPSGAASTLAGNPQNGWKCFANADGVLVRELR